MSENTATDTDTATSTGIAEHSATRATLYDPSIQQPDLRKADPVEFTGAGGITVRGNIASLTRTGYRLAVPVPGITDDALMVEVAASEVRKR